MNRLKPSRKFLLATALVPVVLAAPVGAREERSFCDPEDGAFDLSSLLNRPLAGWTVVSMKDDWVTIFPPATAE